MKLESLAIIFVIIIIPIALVLSEYVDNKIIIAETELQYDTRLLTSAQDAITTFQINNVNNAYSDVSTSKVEDIESAAKSFLNSLAINFGYTGYKSGTMREYVPAVVFTLYDGYYIYSPFKNTLTTTIGSNNEPELKSGSNYSDEEKNVDSDYEDGKILYGLKPYVYYSCRYKKGDKNDFIVTYTLDNYITVQGIVKGEYVYKYGYLIKGIEKNEDTYKYNEIEFTDTDTDKEQLKEIVGNTEYKYAKINGVKYYIEEDKGTSDETKIFYINSKGEKSYQFVANPEYREKLYKAIKGNKSAYEYYKNAYEFTNWVNDNLSSISASDAKTNDVSGNITGIASFGEGEIFGTDIDYEKSDSLFNQHRKEVIRYVVETSLSTSIAAFSSNAGGSDFIMPKVSETDWDLIENNVCIIGFVQGLNMGVKKYNGYAVVPNSLTKEYVDENDIYILTHEDNPSEDYYSKANDSNININDNNIKKKSEIGYYPGVWKINFEKKKYVNDGLTITYFPNKSLGSYTSIVGSSGLTNNTGISGNNKYTDMYDYMEKVGNDTLKEVYFRALARERWGSYHVNNNLDLKYFLDSY